MSRRRVRALAFAAGFVAVVGGLVALVWFVLGDAGDPTPRSDAPESHDPGRARVVRTGEGEAATPAAPSDAAEGETLRVRVVDVAGSGVAGARVLSDAVSRRFAPVIDLAWDGPRGETDEQGSAVLVGMPAGFVWLRAEADGYAVGMSRVELVPAAAHGEVRLIVTSGATLVGTVRDVSAVPIHDARVLALQHDPPYGRLTSTRTDASGRYSLSALPYGAVRLLAARRGDPPADVARVRVPDLTSIDLTLSEPASVAGRVTAADTGTPVAGAIVTLKTTQSGVAAQVTETGEDGRYRIARVPAPIGVYVRVAAEGFPPADTLHEHGWFYVDPGKETEFDFALSRAPGTLATRVAGIVRGTDGEVIAGATVRLVGEPWIGRWTDLRTSTDEAGRFVFERPPAGPHLVDARAPGLVPADGILLSPRPHVIAYRRAFQRAETSGRAVLVEPGKQFEVELVIAPAARLSGLVVDSAGTPVPGAVVAPEETWNRGFDVLPAVTDADGLFELVDLPPVADVVVAARHPDHSVARTAPLTLTSGESREDLRLVLAPPAEVVGRLVPMGGGELRAPRVRIGEYDAGSAIGGGEWLEFPVYPVDADGAFVARVPVDLGSFLIRGEADGRGAAELPMREIAPGERVDVGTLSLRGLITLRGRVVDGEDGSPIAGAAITGDASVGSSAVQAISAPDGGFSIDVALSEEPSVHAAAPGYRSAWHEEFDPAQQVVLELERLHAIVGRVVTPDGEPIAGMTVSARPAGRGGFGPSGVTMPDGTVTLRAVVGRYSLTSGPTRTTSGTYTLSAVEVESPSTGGTWVAHAVARVSGRLIDEDGVPVAGWWVEARGPERWRQGVQSAHDGTFSIEGAQAGWTLDVTAGRWGNRYLPTTLSGIAAGSDDLELVLRRGESVELRFVDGQGAPVHLDGTSRAGVYRPDVEGAHGFLHGIAGDRFTIGGLDAGPAVFYVEFYSNAPWLPVTHEFVVPSAEPVLVRLRRGEAIAGAVVDRDGNPVDDTYVIAWPTNVPFLSENWPAGADETVTDELGRFRFGALEPGRRYTIVVRNTDAPWSSAARSDVASGTDDVRLVVTRGKTLRGRLLDVGDTPVADVYVGIFDDVDSPLTYAETDYEGTFELHGVAGETVRVTAILEGGDRHTLDAVPVDEGMVTLRLPVTVAESE